MYTLKLFTIGLGAALVLSGGWLACAQPPLRDGDAEADRRAEPDGEAIHRFQPEGEKAQEQLKLQEEIMRLGAQQAAADRQRKQATDRMMWYALMIAITIMAVTLLVTYARSRSADGEGQGGRPGAA